jgi:hypothetical protein
MVDSTVSRIKQHLPPDYFRHLSQADLPPTLRTISSNHPDQNSGYIMTQSYHGRASDIHFFNKIKEMFQHGLSVNAIEGGLQSYSQDRPTKSFNQSGKPFIPDKEAADKYVEIYFSTIYIAYPFLYKPIFRSVYEDFWQGGEKKENASWLALLCKSEIFSLTQFFLVVHSHLLDERRRLPRLSLRKCRGSHDPTIYYG